MRGGVDECGGPREASGQGCLITGSTRGIGRTIGLRFAQQGASVVITGEDSKDADSALAAIADSGGKAIFVEADLTTEQDVVRLVESTIAEYGQLTTLVNNASVNPMAIGDKTVADVENESLEQAVALNYFGLVWMCKYSLPHLLAAERASITNISSVVTYLGGPNFTAYCLSKGAVEPPHQVAVLQVRRDRPARQCHQLRHDRHRAAHQNP